MSILCSYCPKDATHAPVNVDREITSDERLCEDHAFEDERGYCETCDGRNKATVDGEDTEFEPAFEPGAWRFVEGRSFCWHHG
jgi:hypothetical protein